MTPQALFDAYTREQSRFAPPGYRLDPLEGLTRLTPLADDLDGVVMFSELSPATADDAIAEQIAFFRNLGRSFEWKVHAFDSPTDLAQRLERRGFVAGDREAFMVYRVGTLPTVVPACGFRIERVTSESGIKDMVAVQESVWGRSFPWLKPALAGSLAQSALYCAYVDNQPVGTGWIDFPEQASFAALHGGAVLAPHRGRGLYSALYQARMLEAKARGFPFVAVDAAPMSRPLLLRKGFEFVCETTPYSRPG